MIPKSACPLWPADNRSDLGRKARHQAASYTTYVDTIACVVSAEPPGRHIMRKIVMLPGIGDLIRKCDCYPSRSELQLAATRS